MKKLLYVMNDSFCMKGKKADVCLTQEKLGSVLNKELELICYVYSGRNSRISRGKRGILLREKSRGKFGFLWCTITSTVGQKI